MRPTLARTTENNSSRCTFKFLKAASRDSNLGRVSLTSERPGGDVCGAQVHASLSIREQTSRILLRLLLGRAGKLRVAEQTLR